MKTKRPWRTKFRAGLRNAFALDSPDGELSREDHALLDRLARAVVDRGMATPAVLLLNSIRPLNSMGSQAMVFFRPFLASLFRPGDYDRATKILERRESLDVLAAAIEAGEASRKGLLR